MVGNLSVLKRTGPFAVAQKLQLLRSLFQDVSPDNRPELIRGILKEMDERTLRFISSTAEAELRAIASFEDLFGKLPRHLCLHILSFLDPSSLHKCMLVCRMWHELCNDTSLWKALCHRPRDYRLCSPDAERRHLLLNTLADGTVVWKRAFSERYRLWRNWHAGRCVIRTFSGHDQGVSCVQFDAQRIVSGSTDSTIRIWDIKTNCGGVGQMTLTGHSATVRCLHLHNSRLASGSNDFSIKIWDLAVNPTWSHIACRRTLLGHANIVRCLQMEDDRLTSGSYDHTLKFDSEQQRLVSGSADASIRIWDDRSNQSAMTLHNAHESAVTCLRFDRERIVSGSVDRTIKMWDIRTGKCQQTIDWKVSEGHTGVVWKLTNGERLCTLQGHADGVTCVQFNDNQIVSGSYDKTVKLWDFSIC
ncbi:F-box domain containing protein [Aphelenchoides avenae]|nr:F-box domain containing protein [Aphelenchus avenae]